MLMCLGYDGNYADLRGKLLCKMHWGEMIGLKKNYLSKKLEKMKGDQIVTSNEER